MRKIFECCLVIVIGTVYIPPLFYVDDPLFIALTIYSWVVWIDIYIFYKIGMCLWRKKLREWEVQNRKWKREWEAQNRKWEAENREFNEKMRRLWQGKDPELEEKHPPKRPI